MPSGYVERRPAAALAEVAACAWAGSGGAASVAVPVVPDGCMDVMWDGSRLFVAGPDTGPWIPPPGVGDQVVGVRLRPGRGPEVLGVPAAALVDQRPDLADLWGPLAAWEDRLTGSTSVAATARVLEELVGSRLGRGADPDPTVEAAIARLRFRRGPGLVRAVSNELGVSERQLLRRFRAGVGYGPKPLQRVLRFQQILADLAADPDCNLAAAAARAGYADQAHLTRDAVRLAGRSPGRLRERARRVGSVDDAVSFAA